MKNFLISLLVLLVLSINAQEKIGTVTTKGFVFKDKIHVYAFPDPTIKGVTCYVTDHRYGGSIFGHGSSSVSLSCRQTGPIEGSFTNKSDVYTARKSPIFKSGHVDRFYDSKRHVLVYISYTKDTDGKNASHSISVVPINNWGI